MALKGCKPWKHNYQVYEPMPGGSVNGVFAASSTRNAMYIDNWRIEEARLWHRHTDYLENEYAVSINERTCWKCEARCPDSIWLWHRLQQL